MHTGLLIHSYQPTLHTVNSSRDELGIWRVDWQLAKEGGVHTRATWRIPEMYTSL